jgi:micrococcal nuclease
MKKGAGVLGILGLLLVFVNLSYVLISNPDLVSQVTGSIVFGEVHQEEKVITKIIDGDTVVIEGGDHVRLLGIDCDEKGKPCYKAANTRIEELTLGKKVVLEWESEDKDQYGRKLRYIMIDGKNINEQMVAEGYCVARFYQESKYKEAIQQAESNAIANNIGCKWKD